MVINKKGITLTELLAYLAIIGVVAALLTGTLVFAIRTYDRVQGQGALDNEASNIMSNILNTLNNTSADYITYCPQNDSGNYACVDLVNETEWTIDSELGIIVEENVDEHTIIKIENGIIYLNQQPLNNSNYYVEALDIDLPNLQYECRDVSSGNVCYHFVLKIRLSIYRINENGEKISKTAVYENRFSFIGK
jgi:type II secretory pathway pseudopilin PulG